MNVLKLDALKQTGMKAAYLIFGFAALDLLNSGMLPEAIVASTLCVVVLYVQEHTKKCPPCHCKK